MATPCGGWLRLFCSSVDDEGPAGAIGLLLSAGPSEGHAEDGGAAVPSDVQGSWDPHGRSRAFSTRRVIAPETIQERGRGLESLASSAE